MDEQHEISTGEKKLAGRILGQVQEDEEHWAKAFERMRDNATYASGDQWHESAPPDSTVINITQRHVQQSTASIYAKNPKAVAKRRESIDFEIWDGSESSLTNAISLQQISIDQGELTPEEAAAIIQDASEGNKVKRMKDKVGKTLELVYSYELGQQESDYKQSMKQLVRRVRTAGVGYTKLGYTTVGEIKADEVDQAGDMSTQLAHIDNLIANAEKNNNDTGDLEADRYELELAAMAVSGEPRHFREGLLVTFPESDSIIPDSKCTNLQGFEGARRVTQKYYLSSEEILAVYDRDVRNDCNHTMNDTRNSGSTDSYDVYEVWDKSTGLVFEVADGVDGFLRKPTPPDCKVDSFWTIETLMFNQLPDQKNIFPVSDVELVKPIQDEYNRTRQGFREHRHANRPGYLTSKGLLDDEALATIQHRAPNDIIQLNLNTDQRVDDVLHKINTTGIDPNQYSTDHSMADIQRVTGSNEPSFGGTGGATATENSIAEGARQSSMSSNVDDLDDFLTRNARKSSQILFSRLTPERAKEIAGRGATWPEIDVQSNADEISLEIKAGSSGRPNKASELQNFERLVPFLVQIPGLSPTWILEQALTRMDDGLDIKEALMEGLPSIVAQNSMTQASTGDPATDPAQQGGQGALNATAPEGVDAIPTPQTPQIG